MRDNDSDEDSKVYDSEDCINSDPELHLQRQFYPILPSPSAC